MNKLLKVAWREYYHNVRRPVFLFSVFSTPLLFIVVFVVSASIGSGEIGDDYGPVGFVDEADVIVGEALDAYPTLFAPFESEAVAREALDAGQIDSYFVVPPAYLVGGRVNLYSYETPPAELSTAIQEVLRANLAASLETTIPLARISEPANMTIEELSTGRVFNEAAFIVLLLLPLLFAAVFLIAVTTTSGFLMSGLVEERTNRIIEVLVTSVTPLQLMGGKILGLGLLGLTQVGVYLVTAYIGITVAERNDLLQGVVFPADLVVIGVVYFILTYFLMAAILAAIGAISNTDQESRQISTVFVLVFTAPFYVVISFFFDPNGPLPVAMTYFPFTAASAVLLRMSLTSIPTSQIVISLAILVITLIFTVWAGARVFRWGLLLYGKPLRPLEIVRVIFARRPQMATTQPKSEVTAS